MSILCQRCDQAFLSEFFHPFVINGYVTYLFCVVVVEPFISNVFFVCVKLIQANRMENYCKKQNKSAYCNLICPCSAFSVIQNYSNLHLHEIELQLIFKKKMFIAIQQDFAQDVLVYVCCSKGKIASKCRSGIKRPAEVLKRERQRLIQRCFDCYLQGNVHYHQCKVLLVACPLAVCEILTHMFCNSAQEHQ